MHLGLVTAASPAQEEGGRAGPEAHLPVCSSLISSRFAFVLADVYLVVLTVKASTGDKTISFYFRIPASPVAPKRWESVECQAGIDSLCCSEGPVALWF